MNNRNDFAQYLADQGFKRGAEIGVFEGAYAETLLNCNPNLTLYAVDSWRAHKGYKDYMKLSTFSNAHEKATLKLKDRNCIMIRAFSADAVKEFEDGSLDFVYIDANHEYGYVALDIALWTPKVRQGGIVSGHDYTSIGRVGVQRAVDEYVEKNGYDLNVVDPDSIAPTWWFMKE